MLKIVKDLLNEIETLKSLEYDLMVNQNDVPAAYEVGMEIREVQEELIDNLLELSRQVQKINRKSSKDLH